jgi:hypothetical protein
MPLYPRRRNNLPSVTIARPTVEHSNNMILHPSTCKIRCTEQMAGKYDIFTQTTNPTAKEHDQLTPPQERTVRIKTTSHREWPDLRKLQ